MTDWARMEWQARANRVAEITRLMCLWAFIPEVVAVIHYHFSAWWDELLIATLVIFIICKVIDKYTRVYRFDI